MDYIAAIKEDLKRYRGNYPKHISKLGSSLKILVEKYSPSIYYDEDLLVRSLNDCGALKSDIYKLCIIIKVTGFDELVERDVDVKQSDLDRFVMNAVGSGLDRISILKLTNDIALSLNIAFEYNPENFRIGDLKEKKAYVLPISLYEKEMERLDVGEERIEELDVQALEPLVEAGIPRAKALLGYYILKGLKPGDKSTHALKLLKEAAQGGCLSANLWLGDYYYRLGEEDSSDIDDWKRAYEYYMDYGTLALNEKRRDALINIVDQRMTNRITLIISLILGVFTLAVFAFAPGLGVYGTNDILKGFGTILCILIMMFGIMWHRHYEYDDVNVLRIMPMAFLTIWSVYVLISMLFL